jgi:hypothetical protein
MSETVDRPRLFSFLTRTRFLHIEDALERGKLRFFIGSFERGQGSNQTAYAFMDMDEARVILHDLADGKPVERTSFAGGKMGSGSIISRVIKIRTHEDKVWIQVANGPGVHQGGVIKPNGRPAAEISIPLTVFEGRKLGHACLAYLMAWDLEKIVTTKGTKEHEGKWGLTA